MPPRRAWAKVSGETMKLPPKRVLIRLCIYLPIIAYLAWSAFAKDGGTDSAAEDGAREQADVQRRDLPRRTLTADDGSSFEVIEVTPEQAKQMGLRLPKADDPADDPADEEAGGASPE